MMMKQKVNLEWRRYAAWVGISALISGGLANNTLWAQCNSVVSSFPYVESFENGPAGWQVDTQSGRNSTFELGNLSASSTPGVIDTAADGVMAWETDTDGNYVNNQGDWVESPCFDFSGFIHPVKFSAWVWWHSESGWDGAALDTMVGSGNWGRVGQNGDPNNWYNNSAILGLSWTGNQHGWTGTGSNSSGGWVKIIRYLPELAGRDSVKFRFVFGSDGSVSGYDGFAFDYVRIEEVSKDVGVVAVDNPVTGCNLGNSEPIWITVNNYGRNLVAGDTISYGVQVNGGSVCTGMIIVGAGGVPLGADTTFNTNCVGDFSTIGVHTVNAWASTPGDVDATNDSLTTSIENKVPPSLGPVDVFVDNFECLSDITTQISGTLLMSGNPTATWEYTNTSNGRLQTAYVNYDPVGGARAITLDANPSGTFSNNWITLELDLGTYDTALDELVLSLFARDHGDETHLGDSIAVRGSDSDPWINLVSYWAPTAQWQEYSFHITNALKNAGQNFSSTFQVRFAQYDNFAVPSDGISIDKIRIYELLPDVGVTAIDSPASGCGLDSNETIWMTIYNYGASLAAGDTIWYEVSVDGGTPCFDYLLIGTGGFAALTDTLVETNCTGDFSANGNHLVVAGAFHLMDVDTTNDFDTATITTIPTISSFPYVEDFESGPGGWYNISVTGGTSPWEHGDPSAYSYGVNDIDTAGEGMYAWEVDIDGGYDNSQVVVLASPCFDFSGQGQVTIAFKGYWDSESHWDGTRLDTLVISRSGVNGVVNGQNATNWYNYTSVVALGTGGWSGTSAGWMDVSKVFNYELAGQEVQFGFIFASDGSVNGYDGFGVDSFVVSVLSYCYLDTDTVSICAGDSILIHGQWQSVAGTYVDTFQVGGCDSISIIVLTVLPSSTVSIMDTICQGDTLWFGGTPYTQGGVYVDTLVAANGCDSIVTLTLTMLPSSSYAINDTICMGDTAWVAGVPFTQAGTHTVTVSAANGCDSVITLNLVVNQPSTYADTITICQGDSALIHGQWQTQPGVYVGTYSAVNGCDSVVSTTLVVHPTYSVLDTVEICQGDSALIHGQWQTQPGVYAHTYSSASGCDSNVYITLVVHPTYAVSVNDTICAGDTAWVGNVPYTQAGTYTQTLSSSAGCDSVVTLNLSVIMVDTTITVLGDTLMVQQANAVYQWLMCDSNMTPIAGATNQTYTPARSGSYAVQVTYMGCVVTSSCHVVVMAGLAEVERTFGLKVFPNPTRGMLYFEAAAPGTYNLRLYDVLGKEYWRRQVSVQGRYALHLGDIPKGIYFLEVGNGNRVEVIQLRVE